MKLITTLTGALFAASSLFATSVTFQVAASTVFDGTTAITKANGGSYTAIGIFGDISSFNTSSASSFATSLGSHSGVSSTLTAVPTAAPFPNVWQSAADSTSAGNAASLLVFSGTDLASATSWGVVSSSGFATLAAGAPAINFSGTATTWDTAVVGSFSGSNFNLSTTVVPEPSTYAMLAGVLALGYVMIRRRK